LEGKADRVERAAQPLDRIDTDRGPDPVREPSRDRGGFVDVAVEGEKGPPRFEEFPDLAGSDVDLPVDQVQGRAMRRAVEHADERRSLGEKLPPDRLEIAPEHLLPFASAKIERLH